MANRGLTEFTHAGIDYAINEANIADEFNTNTNYVVGDFCYRAGKLYRFTENHPAGAWNGDHVMTTKIGPNLKSLREAIINAQEGISAAGERMDDIEDEFDKRMDSIEDETQKITGYDTIIPQLQTGRYYTNGYEMSRTVECVMNGFLGAGHYDIAAVPDGYQYCVVYYDSDTEGTVYYNWGGGTARYGARIERDAKINFRRLDLAQLTSTDLEYLESNFRIKKYYECGEARQYVTGISNEVLKSLYIPNITGWTLNRIRANSTSFRIGINMPDSSLVINGEDNVGTAYSDKVQRLINTATGETIGWYVLHYTGADYAPATSAYAPNEAFTSNISLNPIIEEYMTRKENLVLIGDSIFGYKDQNMLKQILSAKSGKQIFNCGFGGCAMAIRSSNYDPFCFTNLADAIASGDFSAQLAAISLQNVYPYRYADLVSVDWTKPTTIFVNFINNDLTSSVPLGDVWSDGETESDWDKTKFLEAMTYGLKKIITKYPHIRIVFFTAKWRYISGTPLYAYENSINLKAEDYNEALKANADRLGVSVFDFTKKDIANAFNKSTMMIDGASHYTLAGYQAFAEQLNNLDKSPMM